VPSEKAMQVQDCPMRLPRIRRRCEPPAISPPHRPPKCGPLSAEAFAVCIACLRAGGPCQRRVPGGARPCAAIRTWTPPATRPWSCGGPPAPLPRPVPLPCSHVCAVPPHAAALSRGRAQLPLAQGDGDLLLGKRRRLPLVLPCETTLKGCAL
jgi:hypothetical protein